MFKYLEKRKLINYMNSLKYPKVAFPDGYLEFHKDRIEWLDWLIASYEDRAGNPKDLLEALIKSYKNPYHEYVTEMERFGVTPLSEVNKLKNLIKHIDFIYHWIYYKTITGF